MTPSPRQCWSVLIQKAQRDKAAAQQSAAQAQEQLERLQGNAQRIEQMLADYKAQHESVQGQSHHMADSLNYRQFIDQLGTLRGRVQRDLAAAVAQRERFRHVVLRLEMELSKLEKLQEQDLKKAQQLNNTREQSRMDEWGVMRFQLRNQNA
jgi:flagellar export protein FliJ